MDDIDSLIAKPDIKEQIISRVELAKKLTVKLDEQQLIRIELSEIDKAISNGPTISVLANIEMPTHW